MTLISLFLCTDASDRAIGAVLEQSREVEGEMKVVPVGFFQSEVGQRAAKMDP